MAIQFCCPHCTASLQVKDASAGKQRNCPRCGQPLIIPSPPRPPEATQQAATQQAAKSAKVEPRPPLPGVRASIPQSSGSAPRATAGVRAPDPMPFDAFSFSPPAAPPADNPFELLESTNAVVTAPPAPQATASGSESHSFHNGVCTVCGCSEEFIASFPSGCRNAEQRQHDPNAIPADIPENVTWYEVLLASGEIRRLNTIGEIRDLLLFGTINRFTKARQIFRKPQASDPDFDEMLLEHWKKVTLWRSIGHGLLKEEFEVHALYDPVGAHVKRGVQSAFIAVFLVVFVGLVVLEVGRGFPMLGNIYRSSIDNSSPGQNGKIGLISIAVAFLGIGALAAVVGGVVGVPLGFAGGYVVGMRRAPKIPRPPPDDFPYKTSVAAYGWASVACVAISFCGLVMWAARGPSASASGLENRKQPVAGPVTLELGDEYIDPKGRFKCRIPAGWRLVERKDHRSKIDLVFGRHEIKIIARDTTSQGISEADRREMQSTMEGLIEQIGKKSGAKGRLLGVRRETFHGVDSLRSDMRMDAPEFVSMRQIKAVKDGADHVVGLYLVGPADRDALDALFDLFLENYEMSGRR